MTGLRAVLAVVLLGGAAALRTAPSPADVHKLHEQLVTVEGGLENLLAQKDGPLAHTKVRPMLAAFAKQLRQTLNETAAPKDTAAAMKLLGDAKAGVAGLMKDLSTQQENLMKEDEDQKTSLLLGVLMTRQKQPMDEQYDVIESDDFAGLAVSKALIARHNESEPLFKQAADFLDGKVKAPPAPVTPQEKKKAALANIQRIASRLERRVAVLENEEKVGEESHAREMKALDLEEKKVAKDSTKKRQVEHIKKREQRKFKKWEAMSHHDLEAMRSAVAAVKKGDIKALMKTQQALKNSLQAMQAKSGAFLHLLQLGHTVMRRDCPYCAAQCVDKCHQAGKSYGTCLTDCADAGKGF